MPLVARVAHVQLLLEAVKFSGEISDQQMVDSGRSEGKDSDDGGFDGRWWLMRENRRLEALGGRRKSLPFSGQIGRRKRCKRPGFCFIGGWQPFCGGSEASHDQKWEIGWERENRRREERDTLRCCYGVNANMVHRCSWRLWTVGSFGCDWHTSAVISMVYRRATSCIDRMATPLCKVKRNEFFNAFAP